jgi:hypothetical protein
MTLLRHENKRSYSLSIDEVMALYASPLRRQLGKGAFNTVFVVDTSPLRDVVLRCCHHDSPSSRVRVCAGYRYSLLLTDVVEKHVWPHFIRTHLVHAPRLACLQERADTSLTSLLPRVTNDVMVQVLMTSYYLTSTLRLLHYDYRPDNILVHSVSRRMISYRRYDPTSLRSVTLPSAPSGHFDIVTDHLVVVSDFDLMLGYHAGRSDTSHDRGESRPLEKARRSEAGGRNDRDETKRGRSHRVIEYAINNSPPTPLTPRFVEALRAPTGMLPNEGSSRPIDERWCDLVIFYLFAWHHLPPVEATKLDTFVRNVVLGDVDFLEMLERVYTDDDGGSSCTTRSCPSLDVGEASSDGEGDATETSHDQVEVYYYDHPYRPRLPLEEHPELYRLVLANHCYVSDVGDEMMRLELRQTFREPPPPPVNDIVTPLTLRCQLAREVVMARLPPPIANEISLVPTDELGAYLTVLRLYSCWLEGRRYSKGAGRQDTSHPRETPRITNESGRVAKRRRERASYEQSEGCESCEPGGFLDHLVACCRIMGVREPSRLLCDASRVRRAVFDVMVAWRDAH